MISIQFFKKNEFQAACELAKEKRCKPIQEPHPENTGKILFLRLVTVHKIEQLYWLRKIVQPLRPTKNVSIDKHTWTTLHSVKMDGIL